MKEIIERFREVVIQIATPYSTGTGFYLHEPNLIVTNEHVVRGNSQVVIFGQHLEKQLSKVIFTDPKYDIAFLESPSASGMPAVVLGPSADVVEGDSILAVGHPFGLRYTATKGIVSNTGHEQEDIQYIQHDAALNPGNSGGPLVDMEGRIIGINTFIIRDGNNIGFSLPAHYLQQSISHFVEAGRQLGTSCASCAFLVHVGNVDNGYCPNCGAKVQLPHEVEEYEPVGVAGTIEDMISRTGHDVLLSRRGPNNWEIQQGSARINISYYEKTGLITGDAYLCLLPSENIKPLYEYLLRQNYELESLTFSIKERDIILSLLIYDRYLNVDTGLVLFRHLFEKADHYDNILVEEYGAQWKYHEESET